MKGDEKFTKEFLLDHLKEELSIPLTQKIEKTFNLVFKAHTGQFRISNKIPDPQIPYVTHVVQVAILTDKFASHINNLDINRENLICAALTHDILEDTKITPEKIDTITGSQVLKITESLSKPAVSKFNGVNKDRNEGFMRQIIQTGPAAIFIKLCDSMHNLSRPQDKPYFLLKKLVRKSELYYLPMFEFLEYDESFKKTYRDHIQNALNKMEEVGSDNKGPETLEEALESCAKLLQGKILELHDIKDAGMTLFSAEEVYIVRKKDGSTTYIPLDEITDEVDKRAISIPENTRSKSLNDQQLNTLRVSKDLHKHRSGFFCSIDLNLKSSYGIILIYKNSKAPVWLTHQILDLLVTSMSHKLTTAYDTTKLALSSTATKLGLKFDSGTAFRAGVQSSELPALLNWLQKSHLATQKLKTFLKETIRSDVFSYSLKKPILISSRVKSPQSIIEKTLRSDKYSWITYREIEDIAGVRIVFPTEQGLRNLVEILLSENSPLKLSKMTSEPVKDYLEGEQRTGYRAFHIVLDIPVQDHDGTTSVPCELQLRTSLQDTWAKIVHDASYKKSKKGISQKTRKQFRDLSEKLFGCDQMVNNIIGEIEED